MSQALVVPKIAFKGLDLVEIEENVQVVTNDNLPLFNLPLLLQPRSTCETDPNYLQIIPYVIIKDRYGYMFSYRRGSGGGEERLLKKCSIGFGGHVEESLDAYFDRVTKVANLLAIHTMRELNEEIGFNISYSNYTTLFNKFKHGDFSVIYSTKNEVEKYHLCLLLTITVDIENDASFLLEHGVINDGKWLDKEELRSAHENGSRVLEGWSEIALHHYI